MSKSDKAKVTLAPVAPVEAPTVEAPTVEAPTVEAPTVEAPTVETAPTTAPAIVLSPAALAMAELATLKEMEKDALAKIRVLVPDYVPDDEKPKAKAKATRSKPKASFGGWLDPTIKVTRITDGKQTGFAAPVDRDLATFIDGFGSGGCTLAELATQNPPQFHGWVQYRFAYGSLRFDGISFVDMCNGFIAANRAELALEAETAPAS